METETYAQPSLHNDDPLYGGITRQSILDEFLRQDKAVKLLPERTGAFLGYTGNEWMIQASLLSEIKKLFDTFWFEGEICILYASSNQGKSILAIQIAESITTGIALSGFALDAIAQLVLYFDFEMSTRQFHIRYYKEGIGAYQWSDKFRRYEFDPEAEMPPSFKCFEDYLIHSIEAVIRLTGAKVIIIDNLTYLSSDTETAKNAAPLMKQLKELKSRYNLSVLILAHTPKRDASKPITQNDLQGSSRLMQFCDSSFAIGASTQGKDIKYLKQLKVRSAANEYDVDNVVVCQLKKDGNFLHLEPIGRSTEQEHLHTAKSADNAELIGQMQELTLQGKTQRMIAEVVGISPAKVNRLLKSIKAS